MLQIIAYSYLIIVKTLKIVVVAIEKALIDNANNVDEIEFTLLGHSIGKIQ